MTESYVLDNAHTLAATRLAILERLFDPAARANLDAAGIGPGQDVWEVGAGAGSMAQWAATKGARVVVSDIDLRHMSDNARRWAAAVIEHDVVTEEPPGEFDLIHARLVLSHLPDWPGALARLIGALRPGGWLCVEELDPMLPYAPAAYSPGDDLINRVGKAFTAVLGSRGGAPILGRSLHSLLTEAGLGRVESRGLILSERGGGLIADLMTVNVSQTAPLLAERGISPADLDAYLAALRDERQQITMPVFWTVRGQVPA